MAALTRDLGGSRPFVFSMSWSIDSLFDLCAFVLSPSGSGRVVAAVLGVHIGECIGSPWSAAGRSTGVRAVETLVLVQNLFISGVLAARSRVGKLYAEQRYFAVPPKEVQPARTQIRVHTCKRD